MNARFAMMLVLSGGLCAASCTAPQAERPQSNTTESLVVLPGAKTVNYSSENEGAVTYELDELYPGDRALNEIKSRLERAGWHPLADDFLNPGLPLSFSRGWIAYADATAGPRDTKQLLTWVGQWEDASGRIAWYTFTYDAVTDRSGRIEGRGPLRVRATVVSRESVRQLRQATKK